MARTSNIIPLSRRYPHPLGARTARGQDFAEISTQNIPALETSPILLPSPSQGRTPGTGIQCGGGEQLSGADGANRRLSQDRGRKPVRRKLAGASARPMVRAALAGGRGERMNKACAPLAIGPEQLREASDV